MPAPVRTDMHEPAAEAPATAKPNRRSLSQRVLPHRTLRSPSKFWAAAPKQSAAELQKRRAQDRRRHLDLLMNNPKTGVLSKVIIGVNICMIQMSVINFFLDTKPELQGGPVTRNIEMVVNIFFTIEVILRTYIGTMDPKKLMLEDPTYWVDVLCLVPFYVSIVTEAVSPGTQMHMAIRAMQLLRLVRIIKFFRFYSGWRVLLLALQTAWRALLVPMVAMWMVIACLGGALFLVENEMMGPAAPDDEDRFQDGFEAMWAVFWIVSTLGYDGYMGCDDYEGSWIAKLIVAAAIISGLLFTTMPITIIGEAFRAAWEKKELIEVQMKIQDILAERGLTINELNQVFNELDSSGDGQLDWGEFKEALKMLKIAVPVSKMRALFAQFDEDETGEIDYPEFIRLLFPNVDELPANFGQEGDEEGNEEGGDSFKGGNDSAHDGSVLTPTANGGAPAADGDNGTPKPSPAAPMSLGVRVKKKPPAMSSAVSQLQALQAFQGGGGGGGMMGAGGFANAALLARCAGAADGADCGRATVA